jgi:hypothetical protein
MKGLLTQVLPQKYETNVGIRLLQMQSQALEYHSEVEVRKTLKEMTVN